MLTTFVSKGSVSNLLSRLVASAKTVGLRIILRSLSLLIGTKQELMAKGEGRGDGTRTCVTTEVLTGSYVSRATTRTTTRSISMELITIQEDTDHDSS